MDEQTRNRRASEPLLAPEVPESAFKRRLGGALLGAGVGRTTAAASLRPALALGLETLEDQVHVTTKLFEPAIVDWPWVG